MRKAFTLVELLVVMTILAILAGLVSVAIFKSLEYAKGTRTKIEVDNLDVSLRAYKEKYGSYPPCDLRTGNDAQIKRHVSQAFPRYYDLSKAGADIRKIVDPKGVNDFRPDLALVFWLSGMNSDPTQPFAIGNKGAALFDFDASRLVTDKDGRTNYAQRGKKNLPYIYFDAGTLHGVAFDMFLTFDSSVVTENPDSGLSSPYFSDANSNGVFDSGEDYCNPMSFQVIAAGLDETYGALTGIGKVKRLYPSGVGYNLSDNDNVTNFNAKATLEDAKP